MRTLIRATNWLGDAVMNTAAISAVKAADPGGHLAVLAIPWVAAIFHHHRDVDQVIVYDRLGKHAGPLGMLSLARNNCQEIAGRVLHIKADTFALPLADGSVDLVLAQNTIPNFEDFARVCRPGGVVVFVDCSAGWIAALARRLVEKSGLFKKVLAGRVAMGFYILAQNH